jgi:hypothetical protein
MAPFGWAAKPLAAMLEAEPSLYVALFTLSRRRMHLIALALAHWRGEIDAAFAQLVVGGAPSEVLDAVLGRRPDGLKRVKGSRPPEAMLNPTGLRGANCLADVNVLKAPWESFISCALDMPIAHEIGVWPWHSNVAIGHETVGFRWTSSNLNHPWFEGSHWIPDDDNGAAWRARIIDGVRQAATIAS